MAGFLAFGALASGASAAVPADFWGVNAGQIIFTLPPAEAASDLDEIRAAGIGEVRDDASWQLSEPNAPVAGVNQYDWQSDDATALALAKAGLRWYALLDYGVSWGATDSGVEFSGPSDPSEFADYAVAFAQRYGVGGSFWKEHPTVTPLPVLTLEIWNEPNVYTFWEPSPDPAAYAELFHTTAQALAAAGLSVRVVIGGLADSGDSADDAANFLTAMVAAVPALRGEVGGVGIHLYDDDVGVVLSRLENDRRVIDQLFGTSVPLDLTEVGWATAGVLPSLLVSAPITEAQRAQNYQTLADDLSDSDCTIGSVIPYAWITNSDGLGLTQDDFYGISSAQGVLTPSADAYSAAVHASELPAGGTKAGELALCGRPFAQPPGATPPPPPPAPKIQATITCHGRTGSTVLLTVKTVGVVSVRIKAASAKTRVFRVPASGVVRVHPPRTAGTVTITGVLSSGGHLTKRVREPRACQLQARVRR